MGDKTKIEWQAVSGSKTAHAIDTAKAHPRRSGARALCGRYPQRNNYPWWGLRVDEWTPEQINDAMREYGLSKCPDCEDKLDALRPEESSCNCPLGHGIEVTRFTVDSEAGKIVSVGCPEHGEEVDQ